MQASVMNKEELLTSAEVCRLVGISYRQLDYWVRTGAVESPGNKGLGSGQRRHWTSEDVRRLKVVASQIREAQMILEAFSNGSLWREAVA
jgi:DNA-binding transcriptional MerR regulator